MSRPEPPRALWLLDDGLVLGGGQLFALRLARCAEVPIRVVCPAGSQLARRAGEAGVAAVDVTFPAPAPSQAVAVAGAVRRLREVLTAAHRDHDVVVSGSIRCSLVAGPALAARRDAPPLVHLMHERDSAQRRSVRLALARSRRVVAIGGVGADAYRGALPRARVVQANNFLDPDVLAQLVAARAARNGAGQPPRLGVLARVIPEKGIAELVDELATAPEAWATLEVAGGLQDEREVARVHDRIGAAELQDRVRLAGAVDDVAAFLGRIDVLVVPSVGNEGQPTVILEALAAGLPVIARAPMVSADFAGLPVTPYRTARELAGALTGAAPHPAPIDVLAQRFGPEQVLEAIGRAAA